MPDFTSFNIMGQCKKILAKVTVLPDNIAAVKTVADSIKALVTTNNTASKTGSLSQKESYTIDLLENKVHGSLLVNGGSTNNWVCPTGVKVVLAVMVSGFGGGGGGAGGHAVDRNGSVWSEIVAGGSGASGASGSGLVILLPVIPGTTYPLVAGVGGKGGGGGTGSKRNTLPTSGGDGTKGGDTKFGSLITLSGGGGGKGGKINNYNDTPGGTAGTVNTINNAYRNYCILDCFNAQNGVAGENGELSNDYNYVRGKSGAIAVKKQWKMFGSFTSGAGGASGGGDFGYGEAGDNGSAGGNGDAGFIRLYW